MDEATHRLVATAIVDIVREVENDSAYLTDHVKQEIVDSTVNTDNFEDIEFVDVESTAGWIPLVGGTGRDNPHRDDPGVSSLSDDQARKRPWGYNVTAIGHFIDIRKGWGLFDDFDGYSYEKGSAHLQEFQTISDYLEHDAPNEIFGLGDLLSKVLKNSVGKVAGNTTVDKAFNYFFNDEYVHAPGQPWYQSCSPAVERYSFFADKKYYPNAKAYPSLQAEAIARFPLAESVGATGKGIPYSVFMPMDNMARYWYQQFRDTRNWFALGPVLHAMLDATIPHHAAGYLGNWHSRYEHTVGQHAKAWMSVSDGKIRDLITQKGMVNWDWTDPHPPNLLAHSDISRRPAANWRVDQLVTWVALNSASAYNNVYHGFRDGFSFNDSNALELFQLGTAMAALVLRNTVHSIRLIDMMRAAVPITDAVVDFSKVPRSIRKAR